MDEGFRALSTGYVEQLTALAGDAGVEVECVTVEGRSYIGILDIARTRKCDLIVLGAEGLGAVGDGMLGGTTLRVLYNAPCDVLVVRRAPADGPLLAGVDGSSHAVNAVTKTVKLAQALGRTVHLTAAYDPDFHTRVFDAMAHSLSPESREQVNLTGQQKLHDEIINDGLGKLYADFLDDAAKRFNGNGATISTSLATGKAYVALNRQARCCGADLIVVSRHGHHREKCSALGSNAEGLLRTTSCNVLVVGGIGHAPQGSKSEEAKAETAPPTQPLEWDPEADNRLKRVPIFVRSIARRAVENAAREAGAHRVSADHFDRVAFRFGMGPQGPKA
jgi:nucleotide-binding universal stress UspA family protein